MCEELFTLRFKYIVNTCFYDYRPGSSTARFLRSDEIASNGVTSLSWSNDGMTLAASYKNSASFLVSMSSFFESLIRITVEKRLFQKWKVFSFTFIQWVAAKCLLKYSLIWALSKQKEDQPFLQIIFKILEKFQGSIGSSKGCF